MLSTIARLPAASRVACRALQPVRPLWQTWVPRSLGIDPCLPRTLRGQGVIDAPARKGARASIGPKAALLARRKRADPLGPIHRNTAPSDDPQTPRDSRQIVECSACLVSMGTAACNWTLSLRSGASSARGLPSQQARRAVHSALGQAPARLNGYCSSQINATWSTESQDAFPCMGAGAKPGALSRSPGGKPGRPRSKHRPWSGWCLRLAARD